MARAIPGLTCRHRVVRSEIFPDAVREALSAIGVAPNDVADERLRMSTIAFGKTGIAAGWEAEVASDFASLLDLCAPVQKSSSSETMKR